MEKSPEFNTEKKTPSKIDLNELVFPLFLLAGALMAFCIHLQTPAYSGVREKLITSIDVLEHDPRQLGKGEMMLNEWGFSRGLMGSEVPLTGRNIAAGCLLIPSLDGPKYIPAGYSISPSTHTIVKIHDLNFFRLDEEGNARFTQICDDYTEAGDFTSD